ncbi:MAG: PAS domain-containing protein [Nitrosomonadales bacterium]
MVTLLLLVLEALLIFHPFVKHVKTIIGKLQSVTNELQEHQGNLEELIGQRTAELESKTEALKESEEKFRLISTAAQDAFVIIGPQAQVVYWNPAAEKNIRLQSKTR